MAAGEKRVLYATDTTDEVRFGVWPGYGGTEVLRVRFERHVFPPHTHERLMVGVVASGRLEFRLAKGGGTASAGQLVVVNPGELHSGGYGGGATLRYTALYPSAAMLETAGLPPGADLFGSVHDDPALVAGFSRALAESDTDAASESLILALGDLGGAMGTVGRGEDRSSPRAAEIDAGAGARTARAIVARIEALLRERVEAGVQAPSGDALGASVGLSARQLLRLFRAARGTTPTAWTRALRVERAKRLLRAGTPPAEVAVEVGFVDQAHLTRQFRRHTGMTPALYRGGWASVR